MEEKGTKINQPRHKTFYVDVVPIESKEITDENGEIIALVAVRKPIEVENPQVCEKCGRKWII